MFSGSDQEVLSGQDATISCVVTGITKDLKTVIWKKDGGDVKSIGDGSNYEVTPGSYNNNGEQTTSLLVKGAATDQDSAYVCEVTPADDETDPSVQADTVNLNVYSK